MLAALALSVFDSNVVSLQLFAYSPQPFPPMILTVFEDMLFPLVLSEQPIPDDIPEKMLTIFELMVKLVVWSRKMPSSPVAETLFAKTMPRPAFEFRDTPIDVELTMFWLIFKPRVDAILIPLEPPVAVIVLLNIVRLFPLLIEMACDA